MFEFQNRPQNVLYSIKDHTSLKLPCFSFNLEQSTLIYFFYFHDIDIFIDYRSAILGDHPQAGFVRMLIDD